jgi:hypothetical protein
MRLLEEWQYKYVENSLRNYYQLKKSTAETDVKVCDAIEKALQFFVDTQHEMIMYEYYFNHEKYEKRYTPLGHHMKVFEDIAGRTSANGYVVRREIVYKVTMYLYANGIFNVAQDNKGNSVGVSKQ